MESLAPLPHQALEPFGEHPELALPDLVERLEGEEAFDNDDAVTELSHLHMIDDQTVDVPGLGPHRFNDWSRRQAESILGVRFARWFEHAGSSEIADEMNRRLARAEGPVRVRTRRSRRGAGPGEVRALLGPGYSPVSDSTIARLLVKALKPSRRSN